MRKGSQRILICVIVMMMALPIACVGNAEAKGRGPTGGGATHFSGYVNGVTETTSEPLVGAQVTANYYVKYGISTFTWQYSTTTVSTPKAGYFVFTLPASIPLHYDSIIYSYGVKLTASYPGHWTENSPIFYANSSYVFRLAEDQVAHVPVFLSYSNTNDVTFETMQEITVAIKVGGYAAGSGLDFEFSASITSQDFSNAGQLQIIDDYMSTGVYHYDKTKGTFVIEDSGLYGPRLIRHNVNSTNPLAYPETLSPSRGDLFYDLDPGRGCGDYLTYGGSLQVQLGADVSVGFGVPPISMSFNLKAYLKVTVEVVNSVHWVITNDDTQAHQYAVHYQLDKQTKYILAVHVWQTQ